jgi:hypothetical protein
MTAYKPRDVQPEVEGRRMLIEDTRGRRRLIARIRRNWYWGRTHGWGDLVEEHDLNPLVRMPRVVRKWRWRRSHGLPGRAAVPVFLVGVQRSGTNMIAHGLDEAPEFEVHNEGSKRAFDNFKLRPDAVIRDLVDSSRHRFVLFKPLCDSHRVDLLLDEVHTANPGLAVWTYRGVDGRVLSALAKFGDANLRVLQEFGAGQGSHRWQVQRLSQDSIDLIRSFDLAAMSAASGAALLWYVRNRLYFEAGLHDRSDITLVSYDRFLRDPAQAMRHLCDFLGFAYHPRLVAHVSPRRSSRERSIDIDPRIRARCTDLQAALDAALVEKQARAGDTSVR